MSTNEPSNPTALSRRGLMRTAALTGAALAVPRVADADRKRYGARPPAGMVRLGLPGKVVKVSSSGTLQPNELWPKADAAKRMLARAMTELTGKQDLGEAFGLFVHKDDQVAIKPNGISGRRKPTMAPNKELVLEIVRGVMQAGVPAGNITIFEQYESFLRGTRVVDKKLQIDPEFPAGVKTAIHRNRDAKMDEIKVAGIRTKYVTPFTEASVVINVPLIKDHGICGYTGCLKNITHGAIINPGAYHKHKASPQIAQLYAQDVVKSRVALHITDGFKLLYDGGPIDKKPECRVPYETVWACTDPVAMDLLGWEVIDQYRQKKGLDTLAKVGREPSYIRIAGELGLGVYDRKLIQLSEVTV